MWTPDFPFPVQTAPRHALAMLATGADDDTCIANNSRFWLLTLLRTSTLALVFVGRGRGDFRRLHEFADVSVWYR